MVQTDAGAAVLLWLLALAAVASAVAGWFFVIAVLRWWERRERATQDAARRLAVLLAPRQHHLPPGDVREGGRYSCTLQPGKFPSVYIWVHRVSDSQDYYILWDADSWEHAAVYQQGERWVALVRGDGYSFNLWHCEPTRIGDFPTQEAAEREIHRAFRIYDDQLQAPIYTEDAASAELSRMASVFRGHLIKAHR